MSNMVLYGSYNMNAQKCAVSKINPRSLPGNRIQRQSVARQHGTTQVDHHYAEKSIQMTGRIKRPSGHTPTFREIQDEFDNAMSKNQRFLRIVREYTNIDDADVHTNWAGTDDATGLATDAYNYQVNSSSFSFDVDVSGSANNYATVSNSSVTSLDLSDEEDSGNVEFWIFIPDSTFIEYLQLRWGSGASDYWYEDEIRTNYEGKNLETGWNYISVYWPTAETTGSPDSSAIDYLLLRVNYSASQTDDSGFLLNGFRWIDEDDLENYTATVEVLDMQEGHFNVDWQPFTVSFLCNDPFAYGSHDLQVLERDTITSAVAEDVMNLSGSYGPAPEIRYTINTPTGLEQITYRNVSTNEEMTVTTVFTAADTLRIDTMLQSCTLNGVDVDYSGVFPRHVVGQNSVRTSLVVAGTDTQEMQTQTATFGNDSGRWYAQSFTAGATGRLTSFQVYLKRISASASITFDLYDDNANKPGNFLVSGGTVNVTSTTLTWYTLSFSQNVVNVTKYWIVAELWPDAANYTNWGVSNDGTDRYANGDAAASSDDGVTWDIAGDGGVVKTNRDLNFIATIVPLVDVNYDWDIFYKKRFV